jgi:hypothetical protein
MRGKQNMWKKYLTAAAILSASSGPDLLAVETAEASISGKARLIEATYTAEPGNWFVICASTKDRSAASRQARKMPGYRIIQTSNYPNLTNGYYAVVIGPYQHASAWNRQPDHCYIKSAGRLLFKEHKVTETGTHHPQPGFCHKGPQNEQSSLVATLPPCFSISPWLVAGLKTSSDPFRNIRQS